MLLLEEGEWETGRVSWGGGPSRSKCGQLRRGVMQTLVSRQYIMSMYEKEMVLAAVPTPFF